MSDIILYIIPYNDWSRFLAGVNAVSMTVSGLWYIIITFPGVASRRAALDWNIKAYVVMVGMKASYLDGGTMPYTQDTYSVGLPVYRQGRL